MLAAALGLSACQPAPSKPIPATPEPPPPFTAPVAPAVHQLAWSFTQQPDACRAVAAGRGFSVTVLVRHNGAITLILGNILPAATPSGQTASWRFLGATGSWELALRSNGRRDLVGYLPAGEAALSQVLVLLSGGMLEAIDQEAGLPKLRLPPSDAEGQTWFDCARSKQL
ncbi:MAG: hypothetical protein KGJ41_05580 [Rhodospirillales bacterium]|nr:hypothetical protein [Rhodospirillales bacterium]MDE2198476.1 hypothetical protein [Rhodospirillales bacterium]MDE2574314.1 hypothetical protein [Rhodospirillales bacterium]